MHLLESLRGGCRVVVSDLAHADDGDPPPAEAAQLSSRDARRDEVGRPGEAVYVCIEAARAPRSLELHPFPFERELQSVYHGVELGRQANRVESQPRDRMVGLGFQERVEVVDDLHPAGVERGCTWRPRHHRDVGAVPPRCQCRAEAGDAASDYQHPVHRETMRLVSATSIFNCRTRSPGVGNLMSGCK